MDHTTATPSMQDVQRRNDEQTSRPKRQTAGDGMCIVLVEWAIKSGCEEDFLQYWSERESVANKAGLIGEFLSRVSHRDEHPWITWDIATDCTTYINVGMWDDIAAFEREILPKMNDDAPLKPFQLRRQRRVVIGPQRWRIGESSLPEQRHRLVA